MAISARQKIRPIENFHLEPDELIEPENVTTTRTEAGDGNGTIIAIGAIIAVIAALVYFTNGGISHSLYNGAVTNSETAPSASALVTKVAPPIAQP